MLKDEMKRKYEHQLDRNKNYQSIIHHKEKKNGFVPQMITVMACMIVVISAVLPMLNKKHDVPSAADSALQEIGPEIILNINPADEFLNKSPGLDAGTLLKDQDKKVQMNPNKLDFLEQCCPEDFEVSEPEFICGINTMSSKGNSSCYRICYTLDEKMICVVASEGYWPFGRYDANEDHQVSFIDGVQMDIFQQADKGVYLVLFQMNELYFDIETKGITENELVDFLVNLVGQAGETE